MPTYKVDYRGQPVLLPSNLGLGTELLRGFQVVDVSSSEHQGKWINEFGERRVVPDDYRALIVNLAHESGVQLQLEFRAYDEGAARSPR